MRVLRMWNRKHVKLKEVHEHFSNCSRCGKAIVEGDVFYTKVDPTIDGECLCQECFDVHSRSAWLQARGREGERIFEKYCSEHGIVLEPVTDSHHIYVVEESPMGLFYRREPFEWRSKMSSSYLLSQYLSTDDGYIFDIYEAEFRQFHFLNHYPTPTLQDYHVKIMKDRELLVEKDMGAIDYCSFENGSLYEVKYWKKKPSFYLLTENEKEAFRRCIGKWKCFIVWIKDEEEVEFIEVTKQDCILGEKSRERRQIKKVG